MTLKTSGTIDILSLVLTVIIAGVTMTIGLVVFGAAMSRAPALNVTEMNVVNVIPAGSLLVIIAAVFIIAIVGAFLAREPVPDGIIEMAPVAPSVPVVEPVVVVLEHQVRKYDLQ